MQITIIGGTGFIGEYLVQNLSKINQTKNNVLYRESHPTTKFPNVEYLQIDGAKEFEKLKEILIKTDCLVLLARPDHQLIQNIINSNLKFRKIIYASTILIYPDSPVKQDENSELLAANDYEEEKINEEKDLIEFANKTGNNLTIARLTNVYGNTKNRGLVHWILSAATREQAFKLNNQGEPIRDFIFVEDAAKYLELLIFLPQKSKVEIFNVCTGEGFSINQVIKEVEDICGEKLEISEGEKTDEKKSVIGDNKKIVRATTYKPKYNLKAGLQKAYQNYLKAKNVS